MVFEVRQVGDINNVKENPKKLENDNREKKSLKNVDSNIDERAMESLNNLKQLNKKLPEDENNPLRGKFSRIITGIVGSYNEEIKKVTGENEENLLDRNENRNKDTKESDESPINKNGDDSEIFEMVGDRSEQTNRENTSEKTNEIILNAKEVKREIKNMKKVLKKGKEEHKKILEKIIINKNDDIQEIINSEKIDNNEKAD